MQIKFFKIKNSSPNQRQIHSTHSNQSSISSRGVLLKYIPTNWACRLVAGRKPPIQTRSMEFLFARTTRQTWQLTGVLMNYRIANVTLFNPFEFTVQITFPQRQTVPDRTVLMGEEDGELHYNLAGLHTSTNLFSTLNFNSTQWMIDGQCDDKFHFCFVH
jgi:hypothetical protein